MNITNEMNITNIINIANTYSNAFNPFYIAAICLSPCLLCCLCCLCVCLGVRIDTSRQIIIKPNNTINIELLNKTSKLLNITEFNEIELIKECSICIDDYKVGNIIRQLKCSHTFHQGCIDEWLLCNNICPNCRLFVY